MKRHVFVLGACSFALVGAEPATACIGTTSCTLTAGSELAVRPWTQPARFEYTINNGEDDQGNDIPDSFAIDVTGRLTAPLVTDGSVSWFGELDWHRNNQQAKEQNAFSAALGLQFEVTSSPQPGQGRNVFSMYIDPKVAFSRKAVFATATSNQCEADPNIPACRTQHIESLRSTVLLSPHFGWMESEWHYRPLIDGRLSPEHEGSPIVYSIGTDVLLFHDNVMNNVVGATGAVVDGTVAGARLRLSGSLTPRFMDYRVTLRGSAQFAPLFHHAATRTDFDDDSHLFTLSLDYDLATRSIDPAQRMFRPSIGVTWTSGSDPLAGRPDQETITIGFKLSYS